MEITSQGAGIPGRHTFHKGSARMFRSDFFEWFSHVHPATPAVMYLPLVGFSMYLALQRTPAANAFAWLVGGYLVWTLFEYWFHRLFFHITVRGPRTDRLYFYIHGVHHDWPWDRTRLVMPPSVSLSVGALAYLVHRAVFGAQQMWAPFAGCVLGYVIYDSV